MTEQNSALVEENAAMAKTLAHRAQAMNGHIACFRLDRVEEAHRSAAASAAGP